MIERWDAEIPAPRPSTPPTGIPRQLGEYELLEELGRGGMGIVWRARQRRLNREVALKLVREGCLPGESAAKRFRREAETAAAIQHPYIVTIHEVGECDDRMFLSMELVPGGSLADWMKRVAFSAHDAATLLAKVARGVHHAHEHGVLHRDLKPANILLDAAGDPRVCDFGLARLIEDTSTLTMTGEVIGTPAYLSPEQASGNRIITNASDIYSLGAILYEMLSGHPPFSASSLPALLRAVAEDDPQKPISRVTGRRVPVDLSTISLKCLEKEPHARYPTALALAEDLERWIRGEPILARPVARVERAWKWAKRKPLLAGLWMAITVGTLVAAILLGRMGYRLKREKQSVAAERDHNQREFIRSLSDIAQRSMNAGDSFRALPPLAEAIALNAEAIKSGAGDPRLDEINRIRFGVLRRISPKMAGFWGAELLLRGEANADGSRLMLAFPHRIEVWNTVTGKLIGKPYLSDKEISGVIFDALRGNWVGIERSSKILVWEPDTDTILENIAAEGYLYTAPENARHRTVFFSVHKGREAQVVNRLSGFTTSGPFVHDARVIWSVYLPGVNRLLTADEKGFVYLWDLETNKIAMDPFTLPKARKGVPKFDGFDTVAKTAVVHIERTIWMLNCETGSARIVPTGATGQDDAFRRISDRQWPYELPQSFGFDRDHNWIFMTRHNDGMNIRDLQTGIMLWSAPHGSQGFRGDFSLDSGFLATQSWNGSARVWKASTSRPVTPFLWQAATPGSCTLDPSGNWILTHGDEPATRLWFIPPTDGATEIPARTEASAGLWFAGFPERLFVAEGSHTLGNGTKEGGRVSVWDPASPSKMTSSVSHPEPIRWTGPAAGGARIFTAGDTTAMLWDSASGQVKGTPLTLTSPPIFAAADPANERFAIVEKDGTVRIWDSAAGREMRISAEALTVEFSANGQVLLAIGANETRAWNPATGKPLSAAMIERDGEPNARLSPDGTRVAQWTGRGSSGQHCARVWDTATGQVVCSLADHWLGILSAAFSPDGKMVATGGQDYMLHLCDAHTGKDLVAPMHHPQKVNHCGFTADGLLLWAHADEEVIVWETISGEQVTPPLRHPRHVNFITTASDSRQIAMIGDREAPRLWDLHPDKSTATDLRHTAQILSAHTIVPGSSALRPLLPGEARAAWKKAARFVGAWQPQSNQ